MDRYFYKEMDGWYDTLRSSLSPAILSNKGWTECSESAFHAYREKNAMRNAGW
ncbi:MAG: hypothetical protein KME27_10855 [Lyngbya sp. HA4199-MV5]|nr:hypothetical protein [Lyngbya sp. HA4199-MV5]